MRLHDIIIGLVALLIVIFVAVNLPAEESYTTIDIARYKDTGQGTINWEANTFDNFFLAAIEKPPGFDMLKYLHIPKKDFYTIGDLRVINGIVNDKFSYRFDMFNTWHAQSPLETVARGVADCKGYAVFKYHLLKQMGYKNVKIITIAMPDGRGNIAGHALVLVNDLVVMDINAPYVYTYASLRWHYGLEKAYDMTGAHYITHEKGIGDD